jgi:integrase
MDMAERENFTAGRVDGFACPPGKRQSFHWDAKTPGLGVRVTATGAKSYVFESRLNGETLRITIGDVRAWALGDARAEASRLRVLVDQGIDPRQQKAEQTAAAKAKREEARRADAPALEAWGAYLEARRSKWGERSYADHVAVSREGGQPITRGRKTGGSDKRLPGALRPLLSKPLVQLDAPAVQSWLKDEAARRPTHAALAFRLLRGFINWCASRPEYAAQTNAGACSSRLARDELPKKAAKDDCLQREQLSLWFEHVRALPNPVHAANLQSLLLTGARREELAGLKWEDVDFQWRSLTIRDKVEGERTIPLTPYVAALLGALPRRNEWVFSSPGAKSGRLQEPRIGHNKALAAAGLPALSLHGLRRSFGTLAEWVECPAGVVAQIMGHKPSAIAEKHYRRRPLDLLRMWHTKIEAWILVLTCIEIGD